MQYGICHLSVVPVRESGEDSGNMITQLLYGDTYKIKETRKYWSRIQIGFDKCEGWVQNNQLYGIEEEMYKSIQNKEPIYTTDFIANICNADDMLIPILLGSRVDLAKQLGHRFEGEILETRPNKPRLVDTAVQYLNAPGLSGGKTPFGIDASGLAQMVYKINGYQLYRETGKQALQGEPLSFIEESEAGDLAFFDNKEGLIDHVGIMLRDNYIIHSFGTVRIDRIDHTGIFNVKQKQYTHQLRVIKKVI
ncbi:NlpC/P60 family protein [Croceitalea dokdonensis]|nr:NlpC/P60 family protein [Croceitalea dokdonensis]